MYFCLLNDFNTVAPAIIYSIRGILAINKSVGCETAKVVNKYIKVSYFNERIIDPDDYLYKLIETFIENKYCKLEQYKIFQEQTIECYFIQGIAYILLQKQKTFSIDLLLHLLTKCQPSSENVLIVKLILDQFSISEVTITEMLKNYADIAQLYADQYKKNTIKRNIGYLFQQLIHTLQVSYILTDNDIFYISRYISAFNVDEIAIIQLIEVLLLLTQYIQDLKIDKNTIIQKIQIAYNQGMLQIDYRDITQIIHKLQQ